MGLKVFWPQVADLGSTGFRVRRVCSTIGVTYTTYIPLSSYVGSFHHTSLTCGSPKKPLSLPEMASVSLKIIRRSPPENCHTILSLSNDTV